MYQKWLVSLALAGLLTSFSYAREGDSIYIRRLTHALASPAMSGRGYVQDGLSKAAGFIRAQLDSLGVSHQTQEYAMRVNTFPGPVSLKINRKTLRPGLDFLVAPSSGSLRASGHLEATPMRMAGADSVAWVSAKHKVVIQTTGKLTWAVADSASEYVRLQVLRGAMPEKPASFSVEVQAVEVPDFKVANVVATVPGRVRPDSFLVFTAHYDHLGMMGKEAVFAGANDNASGVAMLLALARHYREHPPAYSMAFLFFSGEEAGLLGSAHFVKHPLFPLASIRFLVNLDLMGNGDEGITVVNATDFPAEFDLLQKINNEHKYLVAVGSRGRARNSDHYWFTENGVPSFFLYTLGQRKAYHDVEDVPETLPLMEVNDLMRLLARFCSALQGQPPVD